MNLFVVLLKAYQIVYEIRRTFTLNRQMARLLLLVADTVLNNRNQERARTHAHAHTHTKIYIHARTRTHNTHTHTHTQTGLLNTKQVVRGFKNSLVCI
jgi:hypothetical protein